MFYYTQDVTKLIEKVAAQKEKLIFDQLNELVSRGILVVEEERPIIVRAAHSMDLEYRQAVRLTVANMEYIEKLEAENKQLREKLDAIGKAIGTYLFKDNQSEPQPTR